MSTALIHAIAGETRQLLSRRLAVALSMALAACGYAPKTDSGRKVPGGAVNHSARPTLEVPMGLNAVNAAAAVNAIAALNAIKAVKAMNAVNTVNAAASAKAINAANAINAVSAMPDFVIGSSAAPPPNRVIDMKLGALTRQQIDDQCPATSFSKLEASSRFLSPVPISYAFPKFNTLSGIFLKVVYPDVVSPYYDARGAPGDEVIVNVEDGSGTSTPHRVFQGFAIACSNLIVRPIFLSPFDRMQVRSYEGDLDYMCIQLADPVDLITKWFCDAGDLGDGVVGVASTNNSPRTFYFKSVEWGANVWDHHWEGSKILGPVHQRIDPARQTGFALDDAWNLNPNDFHANGSSKAQDYIAAAAMKMNAYPSDVHVSPYHTRNVQEYAVKNPGADIDTLALARLNPAELNQGEVETIGCGTEAGERCTGYFTSFDLSSNGIVGTGTGSGGNGDFRGLVDFSVHQGYADMANSNPVICPWQADWKLPVATHAWYQKGIDWAANPVGSVARGMKFPTSPYRIALNRGEGENQRCPSWNLCDGAASSTAKNAVLIAFDSNWNKLPGARGYPWAGSYLRFGNPVYDTHRSCTLSTTAACQDFVCGQPVPAATANGDLVDWYTCAGSACTDSSNTAGWQLVCASSATCDIVMPGFDAFVVALPTSLRAEVTANQRDLPWSLSNGM